MVYHSPIGGQLVPTQGAASAGGISSLGWFFIVIGIAIVAYVAYKLTKKKKLESKKHRAP